MTARARRVPRVADSAGGRRSGRRGEARLPALVAVLVAIALYAALPSGLLVGPRFLIPAVEVVLLIPLVAVNPTRLTRETRVSRMCSQILVLVVIATNLIALALLLRDLVDVQDGQGKELLLAAFQVWLTNIIAFGLLFWELDRGGPVARTQQSRDRLPAADFRFTQDEDDDTIREVAKGSSKYSDWVPSFVDYLYVSVTNSTAFSPTDTMPLSTRAKLLMSVECIAALLTSVLVISRAVGILS